MGFRVYALLIGVLIAKFLLMSFLTARQRFANLVFANPEDTVGSSKAKVNFANDNVERVRRAHQNDIENIVPFAILSGLYLAVANPSLFTAKCLLWIHSSQGTSYICLPKPGAATFTGFVLRG